MVFGLVFMVILVVLFKLICCLMLFKMLVMVLFENKLGVLLFIKIVLIGWLLMCLVLMVKLFSRCVIYFFLGKLDLSL